MTGCHLGHPIPPFETSRVSRTRQYPLLESVHDLMQIGIATIFPELFSGFLSSSLIHKAQTRHLLSITVVNPREFADPPHYHVDDTPYGGGPGMVMKPEPIVRAIAHCKTLLPSARVIYLSPAGAPFTQAKAREYSACEQLIFLCGRYEGIDQRAIDLVVDEEISLGDYVLMGGEVPAMAIIEATTRLIPGVLGNCASAAEESFGSAFGDDALLEAPHYTKPRIFQGREVPDVLLSGDHKRILEWRRRESIARTERIRPDLLVKDKSEG